MRRLSCLVAVVVFFGVVSTASAGTGAQLTWTPTSKNFGSVNAGSPSANQDFVLRNVGTVQTTGAITFTQGGSSGQFTIDTTDCSAPLTAAGTVGDRCTVHTRFTPDANAVGLYKATLKAAATPGGGPQINLSGTALNAHVTISPLAFDFGETVVGGNSGSHPFLVRNDGNLPTGFNLTFGTTGGDAGMFVDAGGSTCFLNEQLAAAGNPGDTCVLSYKFHPTAKGNRKTTLFAMATPGGKATSALSGTATQAHLTITPGNANLGSANVGSTSGTTQSFTVTNNGTATSGTLHTTFGGTNPGDFSTTGPDGCNGTTLAVGATCSFTAQFTPSAVGNRNAKVIEGESSGPVTVQAGLSGTGVGSKLTITPSSWNYGSVNYGQGASSAPKTFTLKNTGNAPSGGAPGLGGVGDTSDFGLNPGTCVGAFPLAPGASCTFSYTFTPTAAGTRVAAFSINTTPYDQATLTLTGKGTLAVLVISPTNNDFGNVNYGNAESAGPQTFTVTNNGDVASGAVTTGISGSGDFVISNDSCNGNPVAANGGQCTFDVTYTPSAAGSAPASSATVTTPGGKEGDPSATLEGFGQLAILAEDATSEGGDFGSSVSGTASRTIVLTNNGDVESGQINDLSLSVEGANADDFTVYGPLDGCSTVTLGTGGDTCSFRVDFTPSTPDPETADIKVTTSAPNEAPLQIDLTGQST